MLPDPGSNPGPLTYESDAVPNALRGPAKRREAHIPTAKHSRKTRTGTHSNNQVNSSLPNRRLFSYHN